MKKILLVVLACIVLAGCGLGPTSVNQANESYEIYTGE